MGDMAWRQSLSRLADEMLRRDAVTCRTDQLLVSWWRDPAMAEGGSGSPVDWLACWPGPLVELHVHCDPSLAIERFLGDVATRGTAMTCVNGRSSGRDSINVLNSGRSVSVCWSASARRIRRTLTSQASLAACGRPLLWVEGPSRERASTNVMTPANRYP